MENDALRRECASSHQPRGRLSHACIYSKCESMWMRRRRGETCITVFQQHQGGAVCTPRVPVCTENSMRCSFFGCWAEREKTALQVSLFALCYTILVLKRRAISAHSHFLLFHEYNSPPKTWHFSCSFLHIYSQSSYPFFLLLLLGISWCRHTCFQMLGCFATCLFIAGVMHFSAVLSCGYLRFFALWWWGPAMGANE